MSVEDVMTPLAVSAANGGVEEPSAYTSVERREAADIDAVGKYEPKLTENGIPADVLAKLLPGDDVIELEMPVVGGNLAYRFVKRAFDVVSCSCALIILAIPMGVIALKIKSESPGPVIFAQRRVGKGGRIFNVYKFRSMYIDAEARGARWAQGDDPRVTPFGKVMRKTRMDEIPQFWNVVKGDIPLRILKMRQVFSKKKLDAFALPAIEVRTERTVFPQVKSLSATDLRTLRRVPSHSTVTFDTSSQFLAKRVSSLEIQTKAVA